jgi:hypothetical protein
VAAAPVPNGILEWGTRLTRFIEDGTVPGQTLVELVHNALAYFGSVYERSGYYGVVAVWACLDNAEGTHIEGPSTELEPLNAGTIKKPTDLAFRGDTTADYLASGTAFGPVFLLQQAMDYFLASVRLAPLPLLLRRRELHPQVAGPSDAAKLRQAAPVRRA